MRQPFRLIVLQLLLHQPVLLCRSSWCCSIFSGMNAIFGDPLMSDRTARCPVRPGCIDDRAGNGVCDVVMAAGGMIDRILATPRRATLKANQLRHHPVMVEQID